MKIQILEASSREEIEAKINRALMSGWELSNSLIIGPKKYIQMICTENDLAEVPAGGGENIKI